MYIRYLSIALALTFASVAWGDDDVLVFDDFETGAAAPKGWTKGAKLPGVKYKYEKKNGNSGSRSLCIQKSANRYFPIAQWSRKLKYNNDKTALNVSAQVRAEDMTKAIVDVIFLRKDNKILSHEWAFYIGAESDSDKPADHDWKLYKGNVNIPEDTYRIQIALQVYGPGNVWFDDLKAVYTDGGSDSESDGEEEYDNMHEVAVGDSKGNYLYVAPEKESKKGNGLLIVLPGGDGSADFHPFVSNIHANSLGEDFALAQPIAKKWTSKQVIVWPTTGTKVKKMQYTTEQLIEAVIDDVGARIEIDADRIFVLAWSSGGPAAYSALLQQETRLAGGLLAMSVFKPDYLPKLDTAKGRSFYILHSKQDRVCPFWMAENANESLSESGGRCKFAKYSGGHGWHGNVFGNIRAGVDWLAAGE